MSAAGRDSSSVRIGGALLVSTGLALAVAVASFPPFDATRRDRFVADFPDVVAARSFHALSLLMLVAAGASACVAAVRLRRAARDAGLDRPDAALLLLVGGVGLVAGAVSGAPLLLASYATAPLPADEWAANGAQAAMAAALHEAVVVIAGLGGLLVGLVALLWMLVRAGLVGAWTLAVVSALPVLGVAGALLLPRVAPFLWLGFGAASVLGFPALGAWLLWRASLDAGSGQNEEAQPAAS